jgi:hypothetical protein
MANGDDDNDPASSTGQTPEQEVAAKAAEEKSHFRKMILAYVIFIISTVGWSGMAPTFVWLRKEMGVSFILSTVRFAFPEPST